LNYFYSSRRRHTSWPRDWSSDVCSSDLEMAAGVARSTEVTDRTRARVLATGELMGTQIGARFLRSRGLEVAWADARTLLRAEERRSASAKASVLSATCGFAPDSALERRLASLAP